MSEKQLSITVNLSDEAVGILNVKAKSCGLTVEEYIQEILSKYCSYWNVFQSQLIKSKFLI